MTPNKTPGVIISTQSLVLQKIKRENGGNYTCLVSNDLGETTSTVVNLRVQCEYDTLFMLFSNVMNNYPINTIQSPLCFVFVY